MTVPAPPTLTPAPSPAPTRADPANFNLRADAYHSWLVPHVNTELPAVFAWMTARQNDVVGLVEDAKDQVALAANQVTLASNQVTLAANQVTLAQAAAAASSASANASIWVSGQTYAVGVVRFSPINFLSYRRKTAGAGTTDPSLDATNWAQVAGTGDVTQTGTQTLTNKTLTSPVITGGTIDDQAIGYRGIPSAGAVKTSSYTLATDDKGELIEIGAGGSITVPTSTFAVGDAVVIFNNNAGTSTITCSALTSYVGGTNTTRTSVTLAARGICTVLFVTPSLCVITGNVT